MGGWAGCQVRRGRKGVRAPPTPHDAAPGNAGVTAACGPTECPACGGGGARVGGGAGEAMAGPRQRACARPPPRASPRLEVHPIVQALGRCVAVVRKLGRGRGRRAQRRRAPTTARPVVPPPRAPLPLAPRALRPRARPGTPQARRGGHLRHPCRRAAAAARVCDGRCAAWAPSLAPGAAALEAGAGRRSGALTAIWEHQCLLVPCFPAAAPPWSLLGPVAAGSNTHSSDGGMRGSRVPRMPSRARRRGPQRHPGTQGLQRRGHRRRTLALRPLSLPAPAT